MANSRLFIRQYKLSLTVIAINLGCIAGLSLSVERSINSKITLPINERNHSQNQPQNIPKFKVEIPQQQQKANQKLVGKLVQEEAKSLNFSVPVQFQGKTIREVKIKSEQKVIALTFDDGPWQNTTLQVLDILKQETIKATFFVVGKSIKNHPHIIKQVVADGHAIGNHTWSHQYHQYSSAHAAREFNQTADLIYKLTGVKTSLFRPPAGILNNGLVSYAHQQKYAVIMWSVDSKDWRSRHITVQGLIDSTLKAAQPGGIVLMHDGGGDRSKTVEALPKLIAELKKQGYQFVTVPELLEMEANENKRLHVTP